MSHVACRMSHVICQMLILIVGTCWSIFVFMSMLKSHSHTLSLSLSHSFNLSFTHSRHAEQVLFSSLCSKFAVYRRKLQCFFFDSSHHSTLTCYFRVHRAGSQLIISFRNICFAIFLTLQAVHLRQTQQASALVDCGRSSVWRQKGWKGSQQAWQYSILPWPADPHNRHSSGRLIWGQINM